MALKATWIETYVNRKGNYSFVYVITGPVAELEEFIEIQGTNHRTTDDGEAKFYSGHYGGKHANIELTRDKSRYFLNTSAFDRINSLSTQFGWNAHITFAEQLKDINYILSLDNLIADPRKNVRLSDAEMNAIARIRRELGATDDEQQDQQPLSQLEYQMSESGLAVLNEWHFAEHVSSNLTTSNEIRLSIISVGELESGMLFSGILQSDNGSVFEIQESESQKLFQSLIGILRLKIDIDTENRQMIIKKGLI